MNNNGRSCPEIYATYRPAVACCLNELVRGKRGVTADTALRLAQLFKTTPQFWMHMQANVDLKAAMVRRRALKLAKRL